MPAEELQAFAEQVQPAFERFKTQLFLLLDELERRSDLLDFLTSAYTSKARLDFLTRNKGFKTVRNPCPSLMAACTLAQLGDIFPSITLVSGFMARTLLIYGVRTKRVAKPILDETLEL